MFIRLWEIGSKVKHFQLNYRDYTETLFRLTENTNRYFV